MNRVLLKITCCALLLLLLAACRPTTYANACAAGDKYLAAGKYDKALEAYSQAIELNELGVEAYIGLGETDAALGADTASVEAQYEKALDAFRKAPMTDMETVIETYNRLVDDFWNLGNTERAFQLVEEIESVVGAGTEISSEELSAFDLTQYALAVETFVNSIPQSYGLNDTVSYYVNDMDGDGRPELALEGRFSTETQISSQLVLDAGTPVFFSSTAGGAAETARYEYSRSEDRLYYSDSYSTAATGFYNHSKWNGSGWEELCRREYGMNADGTGHDYTYKWQGEVVAENEYDSKLEKCNFASDNLTEMTDIFNVPVSGNATQLLVDYDRYLKENVSGYFSRGLSDVDGDGKNEMLFFIEDSPGYWWDYHEQSNTDGSDESVWRGRRSHYLAVVIGDVTGSGIELFTIDVLYNLNNGEGENTGTTAPKAENVEIIDGMAYLKLNGLYYEMTFSGKAAMNTMSLNYKRAELKSGVSADIEALSAFSSIARARAEEYGIAYSTGDTGLMYGELVHLDEDNVPELYLATCTSVVEDPWSGYFYTIKEEIWSFDNAQGVRQCWEHTYYCGGDAGLEWSAFVSNEDRTYFATYSYGSGSQWYGLVVRHGTVYECADGQMRQIFDAEAHDITIEADYSWDAFVNDYNYEGQTPEQGYSYSLVTKDDREVYVSRFAKINENGTTKIVDWESFDTYLAPWGLSENDTAGRRQLCKSTFDISSVFYQSFNADEFIDSLSTKLNNG